MEVFTCPHCAAQLTIVPTRLGRRVLCPKCKRSVVAAKPRPALPSDEYALAEDTPDHRVVAKEIEPVPAGMVEPEETGKLKADEEELRRPAKWSLLAGGFAFPWTRGAVMRWVLISVWALLAGLLMQLAFGLGIGGQLPAGDALAVSGSVVAGVLMGLGAVVFGMICLGVAAIHGLTILTETSAGNDRIESWPNLGLFLDWIGQLFYIFNATALCVAFGVLVNWLLRGGHPAIIAVAIFFLFPILLLAELESDSAFLPVSHLVTTSLWRNGQDWLSFYAESGGLVVLAAALLFGVALKLDSRLVVIFGAMLFAAVVMIYFRLLGRLAYYCSAEIKEDGIEEEQTEP